MIRVFWLVRLDKSDLNSDLGHCILVYNIRNILKQGQFGHYGKGQLIVSVTCSTSSTLNSLVGFALRKLFVSSLLEVT